MFGLAAHALQFRDELHQLLLDAALKMMSSGNAIVESFNGLIREQRLNTHWLDLIDDAKEKIDHRRWDCNERRTYRSLDNLTPPEFVVRTG